LKLYHYFVNALYSYILWQVSKDPYNRWGCEQLICSSGTSLCCVNLSGLGGTPLYVPMVFPTTHMSAKNWKIYLYVEGHSSPPFHTTLLVPVTIVSFDALALLRHTRMMHVILNQIRGFLVILTASLGKWNKKKLPMRPEEGGTTCPIMSLFAANMQYNSSTMHVAAKPSTVTACFNTHSKSFISITS
jgi:hypothetical protein